MWNRFFSQYPHLPCLPYHLHGSSNDKRFPIPYSLFPIPYSLFPIPS
ncbi:hypothetical protein [Moorena sp. SIOASIH]|nr:hypothetical protein [Moorena sp. SIOASIH]